MDIKNLKTIKWIRLIGVFCVLLIAAIAILAASACNNTSKFVGNWQVDEFAWNSSVKQQAFDSVKEKGVQMSESFVFTVNADGTYDQSIALLHVGGTWKVNNDTIEFTPTSRNSKKMVVTQGKMEGDKLVVDREGVRTAVCSKTDKDAATVNKEVRAKVGAALIDFTLYLEDIDQISSDAAVNQIENIRKAMDGLTDQEKEKLVNEIKNNMSEKLKAAYDNMTPEQQAKAKDTYEKLQKLKALRDN